MTSRPPPVRQIQCFRQFPDVGFREGGFKQRTADSPFPRCGDAGPIIPLIFDMDPVYDRAARVLLPDAPQGGIQIGLAMVAAAGIIADEFRDPELIGLENPMRRADFHRDAAGQFQFPLGQRGRHCGDGDGQMPQFPVRDLQDQGAVDASGKSHDHRPHVADDLLQGPLF